MRMRAVIGAPSRVAGSNVTDPIAAFAADKNGSPPASTRDSATWPSGVTTISSTTTASPRPPSGYAIFASCTRGGTITACASAACVAKNTASASARLISSPPREFGADALAQVGVREDLRRRARHRLGRDDRRVDAAIARRRRREVVLVKRRRPSSTIASIGWIDGTTCETSPMSVLPAPAVGSVSFTAARPSASRCAPKTRAVVLLRHVAIALRARRSTLDVARHRRRARAALDDRADARELLVVARAHAELARRVSGMMLTRLTAVRDVAVHAHAVAEVDRCPSIEPERVHARGERALAVVRRGRGVRGLPAVRNVYVHNASERVREDVAIERVEHHRRGDALEDAGLDQLDLAAAALFRRRAEEHDLAASRSATGAAPRNAPTRARRDEVVPARVTDLGERVVLGEDRDARAARLSRLRAERRRHAGDAVLDREPVRSR